MRQYFYLIGHSLVGDDFIMDKVFLQKSEAVSFGLRLSRNNPSYAVVLYKQLISNSSNESIRYVKTLHWSEEKHASSHPTESGNWDTFWDTFEARNGGL